MPGSPSVASVTERRLWWAGVLYATGTLVHTLDHLRRGSDSITTHVSVAGYVGTALAALAIALVLIRHRLAPHAAAAIGLSHAIGISAVHYAPTWSAFSDSFIGSGTGPVSWIAVTLEVGGALAVGLAGFAVLRERGDLPRRRRSEVRAA